MSGSQPNIFSGKQPFQIWWCCIALLLLSTLNLSSQERIKDKCFGGTNYYLILPHVIDLDDPQSLQEDSAAYRALIYNSVAQPIYVFNQSGSRENLTGSRGSLEVDLRWKGLPMVETANSPQRSAMHVRAEYPFVVYISVTNRNGAMAYTPLPVEAWGTRYFVPAWPSNIVNDVTVDDSHHAHLAKRVAPAEIIIVAAYNNTVVNIEPTGRLLDCVDCTTVTLDSGEVYLVRSYGDTNLSHTEQVSIAGTQIESNYPVGVVSGNTRNGTDVVESWSTGNIYRDMTYEWISPVELQGTEFVYTPMWDQQPLFQPGTFPTPKILDSAAEFVQFYGTTAATSVTYQPTAPDDQLISGNLDAIAASDIATVRFNTLQNGRYFQSDKPGALYQVVRPTVIASGVDLSASETSSITVATGSSMTELIPLNRWGRVAPVMVSDFQRNIDHYVTIVTDSANRGKIRVSNGSIAFNRANIPGTPYIWTVLKLSSGASFLIEGDEGVSFSGAVYGGRKGAERLRIRKDNNTEELYLEVDEMRSAWTYAYPLAALNCFPVTPDTYDISTLDSGCADMIVTITATSANPRGLDFLRLRQSRDTRITILEETRNGINGNLTRAVVRISPRDIKSPARDVLEFGDRSISGETFEIPYDYDPASQRATLIAPDFSEYNPAEGVMERYVVLRNDSTDTLELNRLSLVTTDSFAIVRTSPSFNWNNPLQPLPILPGDSVLVWIALKPTSLQIVSAKLLIEYRCQKAELEFGTFISAPCLQLIAPDFGEVKSGESAIGLLRICNLGGDRLRFIDSTQLGGPDIITWLSDEFDIDPSELTRLQKTELKTGECIDVAVRFHAPNDTGLYSTRATVRTNSWGCDQQVEWKAYVVNTPTSVPTSEDAGRIPSVSIQPNPVDGELRLEYVGRATSGAVIELLDLSGKTLASLYRGALTETEMITYDSSRLPSGLYFIRMQVDGAQIMQPVYLVR